MRFFLLLILVAGSVACSSIDVKQTAPLSFDTLFIGEIGARKNIVLEPNESKAGRVFVGLISAGPVGAIATANTEEGFSEPKAYEYSLLLASDESKIVVSRSMVEIGSCVEVVSPDESDLELLLVISAENCEASYNKANQSGTR